MVSIQVLVEQQGYVFVKIIQAGRLAGNMRNGLSFIDKMDCINVSVDRIPARLHVIVRGHTENLYNNRFQFTDSP